ncbi:hypothetical protein GIB67_007963 [Kingdonia uniflora]|uniref:Uncharacterized protein n=1 Tax=Kingdonia uniflora TaxID=39325 RepID=A0A7J7LTT2_9MAGN|nr:hypothetical protein GIB67_007963 [Kingdonia uniflora]
MTPTLYNVEQLVGLPADGNTTIIGGTWGFPTILEDFENILLQDLNAFKSLKARGVGISLSLKKLKEHYAYKLEKVLSDSTAAAAKKKKGLKVRSVAHAYMLYVLGSFLFPTKKEQGIPAKQLLTEVSNLWNAKEPRKFNPKYEWVDCFSSQKWKEFVLKKADRGRRVREGPLVCTEAYLEWLASVSWIIICPITVDLDADNDVGIHQKKPVSVNEHGDTPVHQSEDIAEQYDTSHHEYASLSPNINLNDQQITTLNDQLQKLKEDKEKESEANIYLRETLKEKILECKNLEEKNTSLEAELRQKSGIEDCNQSLSVELNKKCKEIESLKAVNAILMEQIDIQLPLATPFAVLQSHQPVPDTTLAKKYENLLAAHEDVKKKLIVKEDFRQKLVKAEEMMKSLEANNSEWEVWRQALNKALASEGMGDMGDQPLKNFLSRTKDFLQ